MSQLYPVFLKLQGKAVLIVGGGNLALQKWRTLLESGARVTVVAPEMHPQLAAGAGPEGPRLLRREYADADLQGVHLLFAATDDQELNRRIVRTAQQAGIIANAVDDPAHCGFYTPAVLRRGAVTLAISTSGQFPGLSKALRECLEDWLPAGDDELLEELFFIRQAVKKRIPSGAERSDTLRRMLEQFKREYLAAPAAQVEPRHAAPSQTPQSGDSQAI
ncbi:MAG: bifunctional precorrin-2 dehydrogenase/sirohydrochlorin ferrochelatase [SAR324 cluster bacterium]|nr:bifunctional precorrin-2 dehydrogenase/sirohydrochlorin ferrochelatase [SAR324 cluster bacterium]